MGTMYLLSARGAPRRRALVQVLKAKHTTQSHGFLFSAPKQGDSASSAAFTVRAAGFDGHGQEKVKA